MKKLSITTLAIAFVLAAACGLDPAEDDGAGGSGGNNTAGTGVGGKAAGNAGSSSVAGSSAGVNASGSANAGVGGSSAAGTSNGVSGSSTGGNGTGGTGTAGVGVGGASTSGAGGGDTAGGPGAGAGGVGASSGSGAGGSSNGGDPGMAGSAPLPPMDAVVTSAQGAYWKVEAVTDSTANADVTVNDSSAQQNWDGFGTAFNEMGWDYLTKLNATDQAKALSLLFGVDGAHFAWGRIPMGASDYAMDRYTLDETPNDTSLANFSLDRDKQKLIPYIKAAQAVNPGLRFWASPWTPPTWMKTGPFKSPGNPVNNFDGGNMKDDDAVLKAHAQYFVKFVQGYAAEGINVEIIAPQNEPGFDQNYPSCLWSSGLFTKFVGQYLGPAIEAAGLSTKIMLGTMSNSDRDPAIVTALMGNATAKGYVDLLGYQWGMSTLVGNAKQYNMPIWQTEHKCGNYPWMGGYKATAPNDKAYADESWGLLKEWIKGGVNSYSTWNAVLDTVGEGIDNTRAWAQNALLTVGNGQLNLTPTYYVFRHFSQFVNPGAKVVGASGGDTLAFKNSDGSVVAVMYNSGGGKAYTVAAAGRKVQFQMPGSGWATVKLVPAN